MSVLVKYGIVLKWNGI